MVAASMGEAAACLVRVPTEIVKAKMQTTGNNNNNSKNGQYKTVGSTIRAVLKEDPHGPLGAITGGLYRGFGITLMREVPFAIIQFPIYEKSKVLWGDLQGYPVSPFQAAACGSLSGAVAAAATTPLDVLKTRLMLGADKCGKPYKNAVDVMQRTVQEEGTATLFSGIQPRVMWISIGGFVFFGAYEGFRGLVDPWTG